MKKKFITAIGFVTMLLITSTTFAQTKTPRITRRQEHQQERIAQGVRSGELNHRETARLEKREAKIQHDKREAKADGVVTHKERANLRHEENRTSRAIYRQKHDAQKRH